MDISAHYVSNSDSGSRVRKAALRLKGHTREDQESTHIIFLLDTSGSMDEDDKLATCKKSLSFVLELMRDTDAASIVTFGDNASVIINCIETSPENKVRMLSCIDSIVTNGCTNMSAGLIEAKSLIESATSLRKQGIILLTDGIANLGVWEPEKLFDVVRNVVGGRDSLTVNTVGYGLSHNIDLLSKISDWTSGTYSVVNSLEHVATVFGSILGSMVSTTAQTVKLLLPSSYKMITKLPSETSPTNTIVRVGDIQSEVSQIILFEVDTEVNLPFQVSGYNLLNHSFIEELVHVGPVPAMSDEDRVSLEFAFLRIEVVSLMTEIRASVDSAGPQVTPQQKSIFLEKIAELKLRLESADESLSSITSVMKTDLIMLERVLNGTNYRNNADLGLLSQHAGVYSSGRGMTSLGGASVPDDDCPSAPPDVIASPMISRSARRYASILRNRSQNPEDPAV
jgi:Mg-chelatase subunit ChlD